MKVKVNIREHLEGAADHNGELHVSALIDLDDFFEAIPEENVFDVDIHEVLEENRQIAHIWGIDDVQQQRPDLDDDQSWHILQTIEKRLDSNHGISWNTLAMIADELYPQKPERRWLGRIDVSITDTGGYGQGEVINRLRDMADLLTKDMPDVKADVDPGSVELSDTDETTGQEEALMTNTNCLEGIACPKCGNDFRIYIGVKTLAEVTDDGAETFGDMEWDGDSYIECPECRHCGTVGAFRTRPINENTTQTREE